MAVVAGRSTRSLDRLVNMDPLPKVQDLIPELHRRGITLTGEVARVGAFGDSAELSEELLSLIRRGRKRGGASLVWAHEADAEPIPTVGEIEIVVNHLNVPSVVTRTTSVEVVPFNQVSAQFTAREGEGDGSLEYWRRRTGHTFLGSANALVAYLVTQCLWCAAHSRC